MNELKSKQEMLSFLLDSMPRAQEAKTRAQKLPLLRSCDEHGPRHRQLRSKSIDGIRLPFSLSLHTTHTEPHDLVRAHPLSSHTPLLITLLLFFSPIHAQATKQHTQIKKHLPATTTRTTMAFILRRTATTHAHAHAVAARAIRTTSQRALASSSTDYSKPSEWSGSVGGREGGREGEGGGVILSYDPLLSKGTHACLCAYARLAFLILMS